MDNNYYNNNNYNYNYTPTTATTSASSATSSASSASSSTTTPTKYYILYSLGIFIILFIVVIVILVLKNQINDKTKAKAQLEAQPSVVFNTGNGGKAPKPPNSNKPTETTKKTDTGTGTGTGSGTGTGTVVTPESLRGIDPTYNTPEKTLEYKVQNYAIAATPLAIYLAMKTDLVKNGIVRAKDAISKSATTVIRKISEKAGQVALIRAGLVAGERLAKVAGEKIAARALAAAGARAAVAVAGATKIAVATGPAAPFVFAAEMAFIALSFGLDAGDAGGYLKMTTNNGYVDMKKLFDKELSDVLKKESSDPPITDNDIPVIMGPFTILARMTEKELQKFIDDGYEKLFANNDPLIKPMIDKMAEDIKNKKITIKDLDNEEVRKGYMKYLDQNKAYEKICDDFCVANNGKTIIRNNEHLCSYKDKQTCENSYSWPIKQAENEKIPKDIYAEYSNGVCKMANATLRNICEKNKLNYNTDDGLCRVTKEYCLTKGADWDENYKDCYINRGQDVAEIMFGSTIVRGLKQIFDPKQYEPCLDDEKDDGYFCRKIACNEGDEQWANAGLCYPKCEEGLEPFGANLCVPKWHGVPGATERNFCDNNFNNVAGVCWAKSYGRGAGRIPDKAPCDAGQRDDGTSCWEDWKCNTWWDGCSWKGAYGECVGGAKTSCTGCGCIKKTAFDRYRCKDNEELDLALCYPKCDPGYRRSLTPNFCEADTSTRSYFAKCPSGKQDYGGFCYENCQPNYSMTAAGRCTYNKKEKGRGVGYPAVKIRAKQRIIPFSTKDN
jgi:hypothetical protein